MAADFGVIFGDPGSDDYRRLFPSQSLSSEALQDLNEIAADDPIREAWAKLLLMAKASMDHNGRVLEKHAEDPRLVELLRNGPYKAETVPTFLAWGSQPAYALTAQGQELYNAASSCVRHMKDDMLDDDEATIRAKLEHPHLRASHAMDCCPGICAEPMTIGEFAMYGAIMHSLALRDDPSVVYSDTLGSQVACRFVELAIHIERTVEHSLFVDM